LRLLVVVAVGVVAAWKIVPRVRGSRSRSPVGAKAPLATVPAVAVDAGTAAPAVPPVPPGLAPEVARAEVRGDIEALGPVVQQSNADFERLRGEVDAALAQGGEGPGKLHEYPYKVQLLGAAVDHVPVRSLEVRVFQTRYIRIMYDASRNLAELVRGGARGRPPSGAGEPPQKVAFDKTSDALKAFAADWEAFVKGRS
jgi:hypothetical protein